jgi:ElaA protein
MNDRIRWEFVPFGALAVEGLYEILRLRQAVFVVEQKCAYQDADGFDPPAHHLTGRDAGGRLVAYCRIIPPGVKAADAVIGRVVVARQRRGEGIGIALVKEGICRCRGLYPESRIRISAQRYLRRFYEQLGFALIGEGDPYDEDGIPHVSMRC